MLLSTYSVYNYLIVSETNGNVGAVIILLLNAFEQSAILTVSYVIYARPLYNFCIFAFGKVYTTDIVYMHM